MSTTKARKKRGRPAGKKAENVPVEEAALTQCPKCHSTERAPYNGVRTREYSGITPDGRQYNFISWKNTKCTKCGQHRIDKIYENVT